MIGPGSDKNTTGDADSTAPATAYNADTPYRVAYVPIYISIWLDVRAPSWYGCMALQASAQKVVKNLSVKSDLFSSILFKMKKVIFGKYDTGWISSTWSQSRSERKRDPLYHSFSFSFSPTRSPNFSFSSETKRNLETILPVLRRQRDILKHFHED